ncbi:MAG: glycosyltransferase family 9 protein [Chromatiaceae bacterium]|nr:glycosyltransferase family 9 protein [Chromatiaceae bacterium]
MRNGSRILIIRLSAIGDVVFASPLIAALKRSYPQSRLSWLVEPAAAPLLKHNPTLDEVIVWPKAEWKRLWKERQFSVLWREVRDFRRQLRERGFDTVLDLQGLMKSALLGWLSGARERIGLGSREGSGWLMSRVVARAGDPDRIGSEYLYLAQQLELQTGHFEMQLSLAEADCNFVQRLVQSERLEAGYLVLCPFTTRPQKHWFEQRWSALIARLQQQFALPLVVLGGPGDREASERICSALDRAVINLTGKTGLTEAAALISQAQLLIGVDTGLTHMGLAFATPTVALFGSTCPYLETTRTNALVLYHKLECSPCRRSPTCHGAFSCMAEISVEEVVASALQVTHVI